MKLFRFEFFHFLFDPEVKWGGLKVGGIRIRAMSHIDGELRLALAESKQNRKLYTVKPLAGGARRADPPKAANTSGTAATTSAAKAKTAAARGTEAFRAWFNSDEGKDCRATGDLTPEILSECKIIASGADNLGPRLDADPFGDAPEQRIATDDEIQREIDESHQREMARLDDQR
jgi:hypothetical protein